PKASSPSNKSFCSSCSEMVEGLENEQQKAYVKKWGNPNCRKCRAKSPAKASSPKKVNEGKNIKKAPTKRVAATFSAIGGENLVFGTFFTPVSGVLAAPKKKAPPKTRKLASPVVEKVAAPKVKRVPKKAASVPKTKKSASPVVKKVASPKVKRAPPPKTKKAFSTKKQAMPENFQKEVNAILTYGDKSKKPTKAASPKKVVSKVTSPVEVIDYTEKSIAVLGDTKPIKDDLKGLGGRYNSNLTVNGEKVKGWIFSKKKEQKVRELL